MPRGNQDKTREFQKKMRTQGAAGFAAGPWRDFEESLGMDQSVVVDQEGNPVWSVKHTRKPRQTVSRSAFDRLLGGVAVLAIATLVTSVLAIYLEQTGDPASARLARPDTATGDDAAAGTIALPQPPTSGFIERPAVEVVAGPASGFSSAPGSPESQTPALAAADALPPAAEPAARTAAIEPAAGPATATGVPTQPPAQDAAALADTPEPALAALSDATADPVEAIQAITREESPAAIAEAQPAQGSDMASGAPATDAVTQTSATEATAAAASIAAEAVDAAAGPATPAPVTETSEAPADSMPASDAFDSAGPAADGADNISAASAEPASSIAEQTRPDADMEEPAKGGAPEPGTLALAQAQVTDTTTEPADSIPAGDEPAGSSIAEQARPAAGAEELARLEPVGVAAPEPGNSASLADMVRPGSSGRWVINLASYSGPKTAGRMQRKFEDLGVSTEQQVAEVNGKTMYRLRIASFESRADAQAYFETIKDALGLESAWITRK